MREPIKSVQVSANNTPWLDTKVSRREEKEDRQKDSLDDAQAKADRAAESYLDELNRKADLRNGIRAKSLETRRAYEEVLKEKAAQYRQRLRKYLRPECRPE